MDAANNNPNAKPLMPHFGDMLNRYLSQRRKSPSAFSRKMNMHVNSFLDIRKKPSVQMQLLWDICLTQQHNFIADIALQLPPDYTGALKDVMAEKEKEIEALKATIEKITHEREMYKELLMK